jgi:hypothetical protein
LERKSTALHGDELLHYAVQKHDDLFLKSGASHSDDYDDLISILSFPYCYYAFRVCRRFDQETCQGGGCACLAERTHYAIRGND